MYIGLTKRPVNLIRVYRPLLHAHGLCTQQACVDSKDGDLASADKQTKRLKNPRYRFNIHLEYYVGVCEQTVLASAGESS